MTTYSTSYPITSEVRDALARFDRLNHAICLPEGDRSKLEIVRLLDNTHYESIRRLLTFIDRALPSAGSIGKRLLCQTDPFQFDQSLVELFLFRHLEAELSSGVTPSNARPSESGPDILVSWQQLEVKIEVYSPIDFMGWQLLDRHLSPLLKYLEVGCGFCLEVRIEPTDQANRFFYRLAVPNESEVRPWLDSFADKARAWLSNASAGSVFCAEGPGNSVKLTVKLKKKTDSAAGREIVILPGTYSTDTRLFFESGTAKDTAKSQWGAKLRGKLGQRQGGAPGASRLRLLVVDFSQADTAFPEFICQREIAARLDETVRLLASDLYPVPYDIVLPAQLGFECFFGVPIWLDAGSRDESIKFLGAAALDRQC